MQNDTVPLPQYRVAAPKRGVAFPVDISRQTHYFWQRELMVYPKKMVWAVYRALNPNHPVWATRGGKLVA